MIELALVSLLKLMSKSYLMLLMCFMMKHIQNQREIAALESEKTELQEQYDELTSKLEELEADPVLIEKIARERYGMHKADEEIFIFDD